MALDILNNHPSILIVDNEKSQAATLGELLADSFSQEELYPQISIASSDKAVEDLLSERYFDIGITDLHSTDGLYGIDIINRLRGQHAKGIVLVTADEIDEKTRLDMRNHILIVNKPINTVRLSKLRAFIAEALAPDFSALHLTKEDDPSKLQTDLREGAISNYPAKLIDEQNDSDSDNNDLTRVNPEAKASGYKVREVSGGNQAHEQSGSVTQYNINTNMHSNIKLFSKLGIALFTFTLAIYWISGALIVNPIISISGIFACCMFWLMAKVDEHRSQDG